MSNTLPSHLLDMEEFTTDSGFKFSATDIPSLKNNKYCLVNIVVDSSGSIFKYRSKIEKVLKDLFVSISDPNYAHVNDILLRVTLLGAGPTGGEIVEIHGFSLLSALDPSIYDGKVEGKGCTPLLDAIVEASESCADYSEALDEDQRISNCLVIKITDGMEYGSQRIHSIDEAKLGIEKAIDSSLESINFILIGVTSPGSDTNTALERLCSQIGIDSYQSIDKIKTDEDIKKLTGFIQSNITSSSSVVGSGQKSQVVGSLSID